MMRVRQWVRTNAESGPATGARLRADDRTAVGAATRVVGDLLDQLGQPLDAIVIGTLWGDPGCAGDPLGGMRRAVQRGLCPPSGTELVTAGDRTIAAGLWHASLQLRRDNAQVGLAFIDWTPPVEIGIALLLNGQDGIPIGVPERTRCSTPPHRPGTPRSAFAGALRLVEALAGEAKQTAVILDRGPRDGIAWTTVVGS